VDSQFLQTRTPSDMKTIIAIVLFLIVYFYVGWIQPFKNFGKKSFAQKRKIVQALKTLPD
jgi:hypothetical protein